jgi:hypothetical protein
MSKQTRWLLTVAGVSAGGVHLAIFLIIWIALYGAFRILASALNMGAGG